LTQARQSFIRTLGCKGWNQDIPAQKGAQQQNTFAVDANGMPVRILVSKGTELFQGSCPFDWEYPLKRCWQTAAMTRINQ
jgi:hypothetical protein